MYAFFIDDWVESGKHRKELDKTDMRLTQHGLSGRRIKLSRLHNLADSVKENFLAGVRTFVAVGNDTTASRLLNTLVNLKNQGRLDGQQAVGQRGLVLAVLPVGKPQIISQSLGAVNTDEAVKMLLRHQTAVLDLGKLNDRHYFLTSAIFPLGVSLGFMSYRVSSLHARYQISVCNMNIFRSMNNIAPNDKMLDAVIAKESDATLATKLFFGKDEAKRFVPDSIYPVRKIKVVSRDKIIDVLADAIKRLSTPVMVEVAPRAIEVVVGERKRF